MKLVLGTLALALLFISAPVAAESPAWDELDVEGHHDDADSTVDADDEVDDAELDAPPDVPDGDAGDEDAAITDTDFICDVEEYYPDTGEPSMEEPAPGKDPREPGSDDEQDEGDEQESYAPDGCQQVGTSQPSAILTIFILGAFLLLIRR